MYECKIASLEVINNSKWIILLWLLGFLIQYTIGCTDMNFKKRVLAIQSHKLHNNLSCLIDTVSRPTACIITSWFIPLFRCLYLRFAVDFIDKQLRIFPENIPNFPKIFIFLDFQFSR
jgi:hypothetical protein